MKMGKISAFASKTSKKFLINESDFGKYSKVPHIDQEYVAMVEREKNTTRSAGPSKNTASAIKDKQLRIAECELQKCDESKYGGQK